MPKEICEISASSWFYYKENCQRLRPCEGLVAMGKSLFRQGPKTQLSGLYEIVYIGQSYYILQDMTNRRQIHFRRSHQICSNMRIELGYRPDIVREMKGVCVEKAKKLLVLLRLWQKSQQM